MGGGGQKEKEINFSQFMTDVDQGNIKEVTLTGVEVHGKYRNDNSVFHTTVPQNYPDMIKTLRDKSVNITIKDISNGSWPTWLLNLAPLILLAALWFFMIRQMQTGGNKALSFGKSRARLLSMQQKKVTFKDVAGVEEAKEELKEIIEFLREAQKFQKLGGRIPKGVLLVGPPGTGKTLLARAVAGEAKIPLADDVDLSVLARGTPGFSGADLANMVNEAALSAARQNRKAVLQYDFEVAKDKVLMGVERKSLILSEEEKKVTAYHEAGHALVAAKLPHSDPVHKVTIIPRGMALGVTMQLPIDDKHNYNKEYLETQIAIMMGGRIAEELFLNQMSTGAGNDIERATELARKMVCEFGMSDLGPLTFGKKEEQIFLGREIAQHRDYSEATAIKIDDEVRRLIGQGYNTAKGILGEHRDTLVRIAAALLEREVLDANEIKLIMDGKELPKMTPPPKSDDGVQQVLKPEPGRPGIAKGGESPARA